MPLLHLPDVPMQERASFKQRILKKYEAYRANRTAGRTNLLQDQGERYEIAVALHLYRNHLVNRSEYLSRWLLKGEGATQSIYMGLNNEYDFLVPDQHGLQLGDAKSDSRGLGVYLKKAVSVVLACWTILSGAAKVAFPGSASPRPRSRQSCSPPAYGTAGRS